MSYMLYASTNRDILSINIELTLMCNNTIRSPSVQ